MLDQDRPLRQSPDIGIEYIILLHILQHIVADEPDIGRDVAERTVKAGSIICCQVPFPLVGRSPILTLIPHIRSNPTQ